jgi:hypothetical protein
MTEVSPPQSWLVGVERFHDAFSWWSLSHVGKRVVKEEII